MEVLDLGAPVPQQPQVPGNLVVTCRDSSPVPIGAQILAGIEAEACRYTYHAALATVLPGGPMSLRRVFHDLDVIFGGNRQDRVDVDRLAVKMHRDDGARARGNGALDRVGINQICVWGAVDQDRRCPHIGDRLDRRDERVGYGDDLVTRADPQGAKDELQCVRPRTDPHAMLRPDKRGELTLERRDLLPENKVAFRQDLANRRLELSLELTLLQWKVDEWYIHNALSFSVRHSLQSRSNPSNVLHITRKRAAEGTPDARAVISTSTSRK